MNRTSQNRSITEHSPSIKSGKIINRLSCSYSKTNKNPLSFPQVLSSLTKSSSWRADSFRNGKRESSKASIFWKNNYKNSGRISLLNLSSSFKIYKEKANCSSKTIGLTLMTLSVTFFSSRLSKASRASRNLKHKYKNSLTNQNQPSWIWYSSRASKTLL